MPKHVYEFRLFAPNNTAASLIADFSNWKDLPMKKGKDGYFRLRKKLADGDYQYRFNIRSKSWFNKDGEWKIITDPYATNVHPETQNSILKLKAGKKIVDDFVWTSDAVPLPNNRQIVIYEMHVGDFSGGEEDGYTRGKYTDVIAKLNYLADLGVNAIELMPLKTFPGDFNWGYSPVHYFTPESTYGTTAELKELIDKCHTLGIRVIVDGVYNHASTDNALTQIDHDYWFRRDGKDPDQNWGPEFDYELRDASFGINPALEFVLDSIRFWIYEYRIDGIRFDAAKQINNYDALKAFVANSRLMSEMKPFFTVAEYIPSTPEVTEPAGPVESCWNDSFMYSMVEYLSGEPLNLEKMKDAIDPTRLGFVNATSVTNYLANHDQNRLFRKLGEKGILDEELYTRAKLGALILMTAVGVPMIWMGEEFGEHVPMSEASNKINWTLLENDANKKLHDHYKRLISLRTTNAAFASTNIEFFHEDPESGVLCFHRYDDDGNSVVVVLNLSDDELENYTIADFPLNGNCREWTKGNDIKVTANILSANLSRREGLIFTTKAD
ncbi:MAG TPA: alpha-amylase family glycosyl hydrolase [Pyrinomonadaceae bacterium]|nr:alpha-amylase family glycosyl hydrolase [Pyrinomonadaceae bacterium]